jgi:hypothetical protein
MHCIPPARIPRLLGNALLTRAAWIEGRFSDETELQAPFRWQMFLGELSHFGDVEICSKKLRSSGLFAVGTEKGRTRLGPA